MLFELPRDFPALFYALKVLIEGGQAITPATVMVELLSGDAPDADERAHLESLVAAALFALSAGPLLQGDSRGEPARNAASFSRLLERPSEHRSFQGLPICVARRAGGPRLARNGDGREAID